MRNLKLVINNNFKKSEKELFFVKEELQTILDLYSKIDAGINPLDEEQSEKNNDESVKSEYDF